MEYTVELDGILDCCVMYYSTDDYIELVEWIKDDLRMFGGGHADIYDEDDNFIDDVEV